MYPFVISLGLNSVSKYYGEVGEILAEQAKAGDLSVLKAFEEAMWEQIRSFPYAKVVDDLRLKFARNGKNTILGAAALYYDAQNSVGI